MRLIYLANNRVGMEIARTLDDDDIVAVVLHPAERRLFGDEIAAACGDAKIICATTLREPETIAALRALEPEAALSVYFGYLLRAEFLDMFPRGVLNLHPSYLPWNRGAHPNVWSIVDRTPAGVSLHYIDEGVDTGDLVERRCVSVDVSDTGATLYRKLEDACIALFADVWPQVRAGTAPRRPQPQEEGSMHRARDLQDVGEIDPQRTYTGRELIDILRARTFPPYAGAFIRDGGRRVYLRLELEDEPPGETVEEANR